MSALQIIESSTIPGIVHVQLRPFGDERGRFMETFRKEWFPQRDWSKMQTNRSDSKVGVLRGLHFHHRQVDYWYLFSGRIRVGLVDLRRSSPTYQTGQTIDIDAADNTGLFIPTGVAHGFAALTDVTLFYIVDNYYDGGRDEFGLAWNDPIIRLDWGDIAEPILSGRDQQNPRLADIPFSELPE